MKKLIIPVVAALLAVGPFAAVNVVYAVDAPPVNINQGQPAANNPFGAFRLVQCDGPTLPNDATSQTYLAQFQQQTGHAYVPCDFKGLMLEAQFLINAMIVIGVLAALAGFAWAGFLFMTGTQENIKKAKSIFPKVAWGFVFMLVAWFVVYQILVWLTGTSNYLSGTVS